MIKGANKGEKIFTSSGTFTAPAGISEVQVFLVGGGSCGQFSYAKYGGGESEEGAISSDEILYGSGGGGGYTTTQTISISDSISIAIGYGSHSNITDFRKTYAGYGDGGTTTAGGISANGGKQYGEYIQYTLMCGGGNGGSGGGGGATWGQYTLYSSYNFGVYTFCFARFESPAIDGGQNGGDAESTIIERIYDNGTTDTSWVLVGGVGQGTTTRAFGESDGTLYAGGGGGGGNPAGKGGAGGGGNGGTIESFHGYRTYGNYDGCAADGTGGGGGGDGMVDNIALYSSELNGPRGGNGGSGIAIIRWGY